MFFAWVEPMLPIPITPTLSSCITADPPYIYTYFYGLEPAHAAGKSLPEGRKIAVKGGNFWKITALLWEENGSAGS
jgi:hypothetical protein